MNFIDMEKEEVKGVVKWYSRSSNYGFITHENIDYYFNGNDLKDFFIDKGDLVSFIRSGNEKKFKAKSIKLIRKNIKNENLICCPNCKNNINLDMRTKTVENKYIKSIKTVNIGYYCPKCSFLIKKEEETNNLTNILTNIIISLICIVILYELISNN